MKRHHALVIITVALAGVAGLFAYQAVDNPEPVQAVEEVRVAAVMETVLPDLAGTPQALSQWQGKVLVLNFWAPWCPPCREEIPGFIRLQGKYGQQGLQFVGVALDEQDKVAAYVDEAGINYPILLGGAEAVQLTQAAGNRLGGLPYTLVLDRQGRPAATYTGAVTEQKLEALISPLL